MNSGVAAIILAAGVGSRFGSGNNKLLTKVRCEPLLRQIAKAAVASRTSQVVVVTGNAKAEIEMALTDLDVEFAYNPDFASGLSSSLRTGLSASHESKGAIVLLGDMPEISADIVDRLITAFEQSPGCAAIVPTYRGRWGNPVLISHSLFPLVMALEGDGGAGRLLRKVDGVVELGIKDDAILRDIDTLDDLTNFLKSARFK
jgi:molybdenum cofactor cytidylyltransferase